MDTLSFRASDRTIQKIKDEVKKTGFPVATYLRAIVETHLKEPEEERFKMLEYHDILLQACIVLSDIIRKTETQLRSFDFEDPDIGLIEKFLAEMRLKTGGKQ